MGKRRASLAAHGFEEMNARVELFERFDESTRVGRLPGQACEVVDQRGSEAFAEFPLGQFEKFIDPGDSLCSPDVRDPLAEGRCEQAATPRRACPNRLFRATGRDKPVAYGASAGQHQCSQGCRRDCPTLLMDRNAGQSAASLSASACTPPNRRRLPRTSREQCARRGGAHPRGVSIGHLGERIQALVFRRRVAVEVLERRKQCCSPLPTYCRDRLPPDAPVHWLARPVVLNQDRPVRMVRRQACRGVLQGRAQGNATLARAWSVVRAWERRGGESSSIPDSGQPPRRLTMSSRNPPPRREMHRRGHKRKRTFGGETRCPRRPRV